MLANLGVGTGLFGELKGGVGDLRGELCQRRELAFAAAATGERHIGSMGPRCRSAGSSWLEQGVMKRRGAMRHLGGEQAAEALAWILRGRGLLGCVEVRLVHALVEARQAFPLREPSAEALEFLLRTARQYQCRFAAI